MLGKFRYYKTCLFTYHMTDHSNKFIVYTASELVLRVMVLKALKFLIARETDSKVKLKVDAPPKVYDLDFRYCKNFESNSFLKYCSNLPNDNKLKIEFLELEPIISDLDKAFLGNLVKVSSLDVYKNRAITLYGANRCFAVLFKTKIPNIERTYHVTVIKHESSGKFFLVRINDSDKIDSYFVNSRGIIPIASRYTCQWNVIFGSDAILVIPQEGACDFLRSISNSIYHIRSQDKSYANQFSMSYLEISQAFRALPSCKRSNITTKWTIEPRDIISFKLLGYRQQFYFNKQILFKIEKYTKELERRLGVFTKAKY